MARWLLCALVFLQVSFLVFSDDATAVPNPGYTNYDTTYNNMQDDDSGSSSGVSPTRRTISQTEIQTQPPLTHNPINATSASLPAGPAANSTPSHEMSQGPQGNSNTNATSNKSSEEKQKNSGLSLHNCNLVVMITALGAVLSAIY